MDCTIYLAKMKGLVTVTTKLICVFVFAYGKCWCSHDAALILSAFVKLLSILTCLEKL